MHPHCPSHLHLPQQGLHDSGSPCDLLFQGRHCTPPLLSTFLPTYVPMYLPTCLPTYLPIYLPTYIPTYLPSYLHTYFSTYLHTYLPTYIPTYLPTYLSIYTPLTYLPTYLPSSYSGSSNILTLRIECFGEKPPCCSFQNKTSFDSFQNCITGRVIWKL